MYKNYYFFTTIFLFVPIHNVRMDCTFSNLKGYFMYAFIIKVLLGTAIVMGLYGFYAGMTFLGIGKYVAATVVMLGFGMFTYAERLKRKQGQGSKRSPARVDN